ncbi:MAG: TcpQ domain-containing protein [Paracoccaceae bacterium]|nr:TcpQ domain-containing protein [Paracoccaceae bacterium]
MMMIKNMCAVCGSYVGHLCAVIFLAHMMSMTPLYADWDIVLPSSTSQQPSVTSTVSNENPCEHVVVEGETLSRIARDRLKDANRWRELVNLNGLPGDGTVRAGVTLHLPCPASPEEVPAPTPVAEQSPPPPPNPKSSKVVSANSPGEKTEEVPPGQDVPAPLEVPAPDPEVWEASGGSLLDDVIAEWAIRAGYRLIIRDRWNWQVDYDYRYEGTLEEAIADLMSGYSSSNPFPVATFYNNRVIVLDLQ